MEPTKRAALIGGIVGSGEGALFNLALVGAGKGIQQLRKPSEKGLQEYSESSLKRKLQKYGLFGLKPEGTGTKYTFEARRFGLDNIRATEFAASKSVQELDNANMWIVTGKQTIFL